MCQGPSRTSYDELPYPSHAFPQTHPDRLATLATLFGLRPAPADGCRVLELGCAAGGNLIPLALALPGSTFVGIDLSGRQVAEAVETIDALGLKNIQCRQASILDVDESFGAFDYVICHGVYSWVPAAVQDKALDVCARNLAPDGVGYVSYNTYPGWHLRGTIRDMMRYHTGRLHDQGPVVRVGQARALLDFLAGACRQAEGAYGLLLKQELELLRQLPDSYLFHEHLEEHNDPLYFHEFNERLTAHGLRYLGEADFNTMMPAAFPPGVQEVLHRLAPGLIHMEQYLDFLRNRTFRQTLLCHAHHRPNYTLRPEQLTAFHVASPLRPRSPVPDLTSRAAEVFEAPGDRTLTTGEPVVKAALVLLSEQWPRALPFDELRRQARARLKTPDAPAVADEDTRALGQALLTAYAGGPSTLLELSLRPPHFALTVSDRPEASPLARLQAGRGAEVTNLRHQRVALNELDRLLLPHLDGRHGPAAQLEALLGHFGQGRLSLVRDGQPIREAQQARPVLARALEQELPRLAGAALLVA
jgi:methyltransferase-like protein/SAM-dependent methyltransferase